MKKSFREADAKSAQELDKALGDMLAAYPGIEPSVVHVARIKDDPDGSTYGETATKDGEIRISPKWAGDYAAWAKNMRGECLKGNALRKDLVQYCDNPARYTLIHEYGHVVATDLLGRLDDESTDGDTAYRRILLDGWRQVDEGRTIPPDASLGPVPFIQMIGVYNDEVTADLSAYANASPHEFVAEAFAIYQVAGPGKSKIADYVHGELERMYVAKYGPRAAAA